MESIKMVRRRGKPLSIEVLHVDNSDKFKIFMEKLGALYSINFKKEVDDFDTLYINFSYKDKEFILCFSAYDGVVIESIDQEADLFDLFLNLPIL